MIGLGKGQLVSSPSFSGQNFSCLGLFPKEMSVYHERLEMLVVRLVRSVQIWQ